MRVRICKPNRLSMPAGFVATRYWILKCPPEAHRPEELSRTFEYGPKIPWSH
jgi:hypothetical protein